VGLLISLEVTANWGKIMGFQIVAGIGISLNLEGPLLALQAIVGVENTATANVTIGLVRTLSTAVSVVIGRVVFQNQMTKKDLVSALEEPLASQITGGAMANVEIIDALSSDQKLVARQAIYGSLQTVWIMVMSLCGYFFRSHSPPGPQISCISKEETFGKSCIQHCMGLTSRSTMLILPHICIQFG
jgi:hypothetical protein